MRPATTSEPVPDPSGPLCLDHAGGRAPAWAVFDRLAPWYAQFRPDYPNAARAHVAFVARLGASSRVLDLGCGPGRLVIALAPTVSEVVALDPAPGMLYEAARMAGRAGVGHRIHWRQAAADDLDAIGPGPFDLVVIASASAFLDLAAVLAAIAPIMSDNGTVAILSAEPGLQPPPPPWQQAAHAVRTRWFPSRAPRTGRAAPDITEVLRGSPFGNPSRHCFTQTLDLDLDHAVGLQYTYASCNPRALGGDWPTFETELRHALAAACPSGRFPLGHRTDVHLAVRLAAKTRAPESARHRS